MCIRDRSSNELKVALGGQITSLDPARADDTYSMIVIQNMYRTLFKLDKDGNLVKDLCEDYKVSEDGKTYTFTIKDAKWSDGKAVKADDFVYGIKRGLTSVSYTHLGNGECGETNGCLLPV